MCYSPYNVQIRSLHHLTFRLASTSILDVFECLECDGSTSLTLFRNSFVCPIRNPKQARIKHRTTHTPSITHIPILANKAIQLNHSNFHFTMEPRYLVSLSRRCEAKPANQPTIPPCLVLCAQPGYTRRNDSPSRQNPGKMAHSLLCWTSRWTKNLAIIITAEEERIRENSNSLSRKRRSRKRSSSWREKFSMTQPELVEPRLVFPRKIVGREKDGGIVKWSERRRG